MNRTVLQFLQENISSLVYAIIMAIWWMLMGLLSIKNDVETLDKKRISKGMTAMTIEEKQLVKQSFRSSIISNFWQVLIAGFVSILIVNYFF